MSERRILRALLCPQAAVPVLLLLFEFGTAAASASAVVPDDLQLDRPMGTDIRTEPVPNPHASLPCVTCHTRGETSYETARKYGLRLPLLSDGESDIVLCERCHKDHHAFHPVNFALKRLGEAVTRAGIFPLEMPFEGYLKVSCSTCHVVHFPHTRYRLLRGFPVDAKVGGGVFLTRLDFCRACHGTEEIAALSGHERDEGEQGCGLCHDPREISGKIGARKWRINEACAICHPPASGEPAHFSEYNPFPEFERQELAAYGIALLQGRFTCASCHLHHRKEGEAARLTPAFVDVVSKSVLINPHRSNKFCQNCHPITPPPPGTPGAVGPLFEEDVTRLCRRCHPLNGAAQMHHPLGPPAARVSIPPGWPLRGDGTMGCQTCHLAGHAPQERDNPKWLRGGPYRQRNEICFRCHREEEFRGRNIHREVADFDGCEFCHVVKGRTAIRPEGHVGDLLAEPNILCLACHSPGPHPASADHTVQPHAYSFLMIDEKKAPLTRGRVTCHTCHDSHADLAGGHLLRMSDYGTICSNCHPY